MRAARRTSTGFGDDFEVHTALALAYHASGSHEIAREHYDKATELARRVGSTTGSITLELPLLYSGMLFAQTGERGRAEDEWRAGVELAERSLEGYPDNTGVRACLASFYGLLGDPSAFSRERQRALDADFNAYRHYSLAATHAALGLKQAH